jgi:preprotein translocase subunit SecG
MLYGVLVFVHIVVSLILVLVVLLQTGKRADLAGAFGGGGSQTAFGARGAATFLSKATTTAAVLFMVTSLSLSILSSRSRTGSGSVLDEVAPSETATETAPVEQEPGEVPTGLPEEAPAEEASEAEPEEPGQ